MIVEKITFKSMKDIWENYVWPDVYPIYPVDPLQYGGGNDMAIIGKYAPTFLAIKQDDIIVAAIGGHRTTHSLYRVRGLFLDEEVNESEHLALANAVVSQIKSQARFEGCTHLWDYCNWGNMLLSMNFNVTNEGTDSVYCLSPV